MRPVQLIELFTKRERWFLVNMAFLIFVMLFLNGCINAAEIVMQLKDDPASACIVVQGSGGAAMIPGPGAGGGYGQGSMTYGRSVKENTHVIIKADGSCEIIHGEEKK